MYVLKRDTDTHIYVYLDYIIISIFYIDLEISLRYEDFIILKGSGNYLKKEINLKTPLQVVQIN